jgi:hypothetical protein
MRTRTAASIGLLLALSLAPVSAHAAGTSAVVAGGGSFLFAGSIPMQFGFSAVGLPDGSATGAFHHAYTDGGFTYQLWGEVTCLSFDAAAGRAWVGGVLTRIKSDDPNPGVAAGDEAWFRVLDSEAGDRSTSMGFFGFVSSEEYCEVQIWPDDNARTHPVTNGQITLRVG